jgi:hypothetical protein
VYTTQSYLFSNSYSILPAISLEGVLHVDILTDKSWNGDLFYTFVDTLIANFMNPFPLPNSVLVMDNCSIHHAQGIRDLVESRLALQRYITV